MRVVIIARESASSERPLFKPTLEAAMKLPGCRVPLVPVVPIFGWRLGSWPCLPQES